MSKMLLLNIMSLKTSQLQNIGKEVNSAKYET